MKKFFDRVEKWLFGGWKGIHPMGFEESEEDEGLFALSLMSPAIGLICPWFREMKWIWIPDHLSEAKKAAMMAYYQNTLQRFLYAWGPDKILLSKNVISTGRIEMLLDTFPDARIIYPVRHPFKTIPSVTSMFSAPWKVLAPDVHQQSKEYRSWGAMNIAFYQHFNEVMSKLSPQQLFWVKYTLFTGDPYQTVLNIYQHFGWNVDPEFKKRLEAETTATRSYSSGHQYSMEQYGYSKEKVYNELLPVFKKFGFEP